MEETFYASQDASSGSKPFIIQPVRHRFIEQRLRNVFERFGFREITTPTIEFEDRAFKFDSGEVETTYEFIDKSGKKIFLRPDLTTSIAKIVSSYFQSIEKPIRFYYIANSFLPGFSPWSSEREICHAGAEIIGANLKDADIEMMIMAIESLQETGLRDFQMDIGHVGFWDFIIGQNGFSEQEKTILKDLLRKKAFISFQNAFKNKKVSKDFIELVNNTPFLRGKSELLNSLEGLSKYNKIAFLIEELRDTCKILDDYGLGDYYTLDLSMVGDMSYYSGYIFELYIKDLALHLGKGGRYDRLLKEFGYNCPSTGFSVNIGNLVKAQEKIQKFEAPHSIDFFITRARPSINLLGIARELRQKGFLVEAEITKRTLEESLSYAKKRNIKSVIILGTNDTDSNQIVLKNMDTDDEAIIDFDEFLL